jgi:hypothetical protein
MGYHQILMHPDDIPKMAIAMPLGLFMCGQARIPFLFGSRYHRQLFLGGTSMSHANPVPVASGSKFGG